MSATNKVITIEILAEAEADLTPKQWLKVKQFIENEIGSMGTTIETSRESVDVQFSYDGCQMKEPA